MLAQNEHWQKLNQAWSSLAVREQRLLKLLALVLGFWLVYQLIWSPIHTGAQQAQQNLTQAQNQWQWLNQQAPIIQAAKTHAPAITTQSQMIARLQQSLRNHNIADQAQAITPMQQGVQVSFEQVAAPLFFQWLSFIEQQGLVADRMQLEPIETGVIKVTLLFRLAL